MCHNLYYLRCLQDEERREREKLASEWKAQQEKIKSVFVVKFYELTLLVNTVYRRRHCHHLQLLGWVWSSQNDYCEIY